MSAKLIPLKPNEVADRLKDGRAVLVDIRGADEFSRRRARGAVCHPVDRLAESPPAAPAGREVIFTCRSGMRTAANAERLCQAVGGDAYVLEGGLDAWAAAGLGVEEDRKAPLELIRQVQITAGLLILTGVVLGYAVAPGFFLLSGFVGAGLTFAGVTGSCAMARLLALAPWNRPAAAA